VVVVDFVVAECYVLVLVLCEGYELFGGVWEVVG